MKGKETNGKKEGEERGKRKRGERRKWWWRCCRNWVNYEEDWEAEEEMGRMKRWRE